MTPAERDRVAAYLAESREKLVRSTQDLSRTQLQFKPAPDRWSVAECIEHIIVVEDLVLGNVKSTLQQAPGSPGSALDDDSIVKAVAGRATRIKGPERLMPTGRWGHDQLLSEFEAARKRTAAFAASTDAPLREHAYAHPVIGPLDCYQWLLLIAAHGERHRAQAEEVMAEAAFPRAAAAH